MAKNARCSTCGAALEPGAGTCPSCGKLVAAPVNTTAQVLIGLAAGFVFGLGIAASIITAELGSAQFIYEPGHRILGIVVIVAAGILVPVVIFFAGLTFATRGRPGLAVFLITSAGIGFLVPSPCTFSILSTLGDRSATTGHIQPVPAPPQPAAPSTAPFYTAAPVTTFGPARTPRPVVIPSNG